MRIFPITDTRCQSPPSRIFEPSLTSHPQPPSTSKPSKFTQEKWMPMKRKRSSNDTETPPSPDHRPSSRASTSSSQSGMCITGSAGRRMRRNRGGSESQFPGKLYDLLEWVADNGMESVISWTRSGTALMIHDPEKLVEILPKFFGQTKYRSFRRQLNMWHFQRIMEGPHRGAFTHPCFIRGNKERINFMSRQIYTSSAPSPVEFESQGTQNHAFHDWQPQQQIVALQPPTFGVSGMFGSQGTDSFSYLHQDTRLGSVTTSSASDYDFSVARAPVLPSAHNPDVRIEVFEPSAICLTESPVMSSSTNNAFPGLSIDTLSDGDPITFAGRQFHFVDYSSHRHEHAAKAAAIHDSHPKDDSNAKTRALDAFANDAPLIVSDVLLEPLTPTDFDYIFDASTDNATGL